jgi:hypothetical protein
MTMIKDKYLSKEKESYYQNNDGPELLKQAQYNDITHKVDILQFVSLHVDIVYQHHLHRVCPSSF